MTAMNVSQFKKPECFGNYAHEDFCYNKERQKRKCPFRNECFKEASEKVYCKGNPSKCEFCGKPAFCYMVEPVNCGTIVLNLLTHKFQDSWHVEWIEHWLCPKHLEEIKQLSKVKR